VYPALAVLQSIKESAEVLWVGGIGGMETGLVERSGIPYQAIPAAGVHGVGLRTLPRNLWQLGRGVMAARKILRQFNPDVLFFTGGYVAVPMALAGLKVPSLLYVPDIEPGLALKTLARFADRIAISAEASKRYFKRPERLHLSGYPTRPDLGKWTRSEAFKALTLNEEFPVLLVSGGSKGARSINQAVAKALPGLLERLQVVHLTGELDWQDMQEKTKYLSEKQAARYHAYPYLHEEMGAALSAADLVISRAGASTLGEYPLFGIPAILVPYPHAWRYQKVNAEYLVEHGAALMLEDGQLAEAIIPVVEDLFNHPEKLSAMHEAMQKLAYPAAAEEIGRQLLALSRERR
jgi:UDP-N-acetylglucosamine--N-acetylmuramyl-(pentapeptide) pyrophosphoryl-undecaprenol N-acetylglucosamine transferase